MGYGQTPPPPTYTPSCIVVYTGVLLVEIVYPPWSSMGRAGVYYFYSLLLLVYRSTYLYGLPGGVLVLSSV
uniref:Uncharacterized protein n=1 Tax=viral metagenome TaxID=1070528 RepID=A0A6C0JS98_9ZZZZ